MPRAIIIDKTTFTNPKIPKAISADLLLYYKQCAENPDKINLSILKYQVIRSFRFLIDNDINLKELDPEERDFLFDDLMNFCFKKIVFALVRNKTSILKKGRPLNSYLEDAFYIFKYDRLCAKESQKKDDEAVVLDYINRVSYKKVMESLKRYDYFSRVYSILKEDYNSNDLEKKLFSSIILTEGFQENFKDQFCKKIINSLDKNSKDNFIKYKEKLYNLMKKCFDEYSKDILNGEF